VSIAGLILAGGRSIRFGQDKATALLAQAPLIAHVWRVLAPDCERVAVSARPGSEAQAWAHGLDLPVLHDDVAGSSGPLWGIHAGLVWARDLAATRLAVCPCDTPSLPHGLIAALAAADQGRGAAAADSAGGLHALCSLWPIEALDTVTAQLAHQHHMPIHRLQAELGFAIAPLGPPQAFANVNSPDDLARLSPE
jgi:molybdopterin-guanine dinucleotide biosynthesis protein A